MTTDPLADALAELLRAKAEDSCDDKTVKAFDTICNAVLSGDLMPRSDHLAALAAANEAAAAEIDSLIIKWQDDDREEFHPEDPDRPDYLGEAVELIHNMPLAIRALTTADQQAALDRVKREARALKPEHAQILAKEMQMIVAADRWKGRDLSAAPPEKWSHLRPETQQFWIDTATRILAALADGEPT